MSYTLLILYFLSFSFFGWILDSISCTITQKRIVNSGYFQELPLCPLYGLGGLVLFFLMKHMAGYHPVIVILTATLAVNVVEYIGGVWCITILKERLWDYSWRKYHLHGHIDLIHAICWLILVTLVYQFLFPTALRFDDYMQRTFVVPTLLDRITTVLFIIGSIILTISRRTHRLKKQSIHTKKRRYSR